MPSQNIRSKILLWSFVLALVLLTANIILKNNFKLPNSVDENVESTEIKNRFKKVLNEFSIEDNLIRETITNDKVSGREVSLIKVQVPADLTIPEILQDIYETFKKDSLKLISEEIVKDGKSVLTFKKNRTTLLRAEFNYAKNIFRHKGIIAFIVKEINPVNTTDNNLIESSTKFNLLIRPDSKLIQHLDFLKENQKQYSILIDDEIREQKYRLAASFSVKRVMTVVQTLLKDFSGAVCFIIDQNSDFYKSSNRKIFTTELSKRNIKTFSFSDFVKLDNTQDALDFFLNETEEFNSNDKKIFLMDETTFIRLIPEIQKLKKRGCKIVESSLLF